MNDSEKQMQAALYYTVLYVPSELGPKFCELLETMESLEWMPDPAL